MAYDNHGGNGDANSRTPFLTYFRHGEIVALMKYAGPNDGEREPLTPADLDALREVLKHNDRIAHQKSRRSERDPFHPNPFQGPVGPRTPLLLSRLQKSERRELERFEAASREAQGYQIEGGQAERDETDGQETVDSYVLGINLASWMPSPARLDPHQVPAHFKQAHKAVGDVPRVVRDLNEAAERAIRENQPLKIGNFECQAFAPNWLAFAMDSACSGCPGGRPVPPEEEDPKDPENKPGKPRKFNPNDPPRFRPGDVREWVDRLTARVREENRLGPLQANHDTTGDGVMVAVFDTWPMDDEPVEPTGPMGKASKIRAKFKRDPNAKPVPLLEDFLDTQTVAAADVWDFASASWLNMLDAHPTKPTGDFEPAYPIPDHGLFVADIIKQIAPNCDLVVYRVLNDVGGIDYLTLAAAIEDARAKARRARKRLVMNLSLGFGPQVQMIQDYLHRYQAERAYEDGNAWGRYLREHAPPVEKGERGLEFREQEAAVLIHEPTLAMINHLFDFKNDPRVLVVAAAGNDSDRYDQANEGKPHAWGPRTPAAIEGVLGVSSHRDNDGRLSSYTNDDDIAGAGPFYDDGVRAYSGDCTIEEGLRVTDEGLIGLYLSDPFPPPAEARNVYGLARWTGTSFSTPIVAGLAACIWSAYPTWPSNGVLKAICSETYIDLRQR